MWKLRLAREYRYAAAPVAGFVSYFRLFGRTVAFRDTSGRIVTTW